MKVFIITVNKDHYWSILVSLVMQNYKHKMVQAIVMHSVCCHIM